MDKHAHPTTDAPNTITALGKDADTILRVGKLLLQGGTDVYRVIRAMKRTARSLGFDAFDASVSLTSIRFTVRRAEHFRTVVCVINSPAVDATLIEAVEDLSHRLPDVITADWMNERLDRIEANRGHRWGKHTLALAAGIACAAFAILNHFPVISAAIVAIAALCGQYVRMALGRRHFNQLGTSAFAGVAACLIYFGITKTFHLVGILHNTANLEPGYVASVLFLIPGFPLFTSLLDLARLDISAGWERFLYACSLILSATMAVWGVSALTGLHPLSPVATVDSEWIWLVTAGIASIAGIAGFAVLFNSSKRMIVVASVAGALANVVKFAALGFHVPSQMSCFIGGVTIGLIASIIRNRVYLPRITMTIPASVIMIPGTEMFRGIYYLNLGDISEALNHSVASALQVFAIAGGLVFMRLLTDRDWGFQRQIDFERRIDHSQDAHPNGVTWA